MGKSNATKGSFMYGYCLGYQSHVFAINNLHLELSSQNLHPPCKLGNKTVYCKAKEERAG